MSGKSRDRTRKLQKSKLRQRSTVSGNEEPETSVGDEMEWEPTKDTSVDISSGQPESVPSQNPTGYDSDEDEDVIMSDAPDLSPTAGSSASLGNLLGAVTPKHGVSKAAEDDSREANDGGALVESNSHKAGDEAAATNNTQGEEQQMPSRREAFRKVQLARMNAAGCGNADKSSSGSEHEDAIEGRPGGKRRRA